MKNFTKFNKYSIIMLFSATVLMFVGLITYATAENPRSPDVLRIYVAVFILSTGLLASALASIRIFYNKIITAALEDVSQLTEDLIKTRTELLFNRRLIIADFLWNELGRLTVNEEGEIQQRFLQFGEGTDREEIWDWFENEFHFSVGKRYFSS